MAGRCVGFGVAAAAIALPILFLVFVSYLILFRLLNRGDSVHFIKVA